MRRAIRVHALGGETLCWVQVPDAKFSRRYLLIKSRPLFLQGMRRSRRGLLTPPASLCSLHIRWEEAQRHTHAHGRTALAHRRRPSAKRT